VNFKSVCEEKEKNFGNFSLMKLGEADRVTKKNLRNLSKKRSFFFQVHPDPKDKSRLIS